MARGEAVRWRPYSLAFPAPLALFGRVADLCCAFGAVPLLPCSQMCTAFCGLLPVHVWLYTVQSGAV